MVGEGRVVSPLAEPEAGRYTGSSERGEAKGGNRHQGYAPCFGIVQINGKGNLATETKTENTQNKNPTNQQQKQLAQQKKKKKSRLPPHPSPNKGGGGGGVGGGGGGGRGRRGKRDKVWESQQKVIRHILQLSSVK